MSDISSIGSGGHGAIGPVNRAAAIHLNGTAKTAGGLNADPLDGSDRPSIDRVELSDFARYLDQLRQLPSLPKDRVGQIRQSIDSGTYETPEKLDIALERLIDHLQS